MTNNNGHVTHPVIADALNKLDERKQEILGLTKAVEVLEAALKEFKILAGISIDTNTALSCRNGQVCTIAMIQNVSEMQPILKFLADRGFRQSKEPKDVPSLSARIWICGQIGITVLITPSHDGSGKSCHYVEVGKKEVPVYELQCEEIDSAPNNSN